MAARGAAARRAASRFASGAPLGAAQTLASSTGAMQTPAASTLRSKGGDPKMVFCKVAVFSARALHFLVVETSTSTRGVRQLSTRKQTSRVSHAATAATSRARAGHGRSCRPSCRRVERRGARGGAVRGLRRADVVRRADHHAAHARRAQASGGA
eukprot:scaffold114885_cov63-Phaeocystis_antarctica.AAC.9